MSQWAFLKLTFGQLGMKEWKRKWKVLVGFRVEGGNERFCRDYYKDPLLHSQLTKGKEIEGSSIIMRA